MATALKLKNDINKLKAALRSKATPKSFIPKLKSQLDKAEADYESVKAGKKSAPKAGKQVKSTMDKLKAIIKKKKYGAYRAQGVDLKKDAKKPALPTGKRISKNGNTYYEYRANRIDVKQPPKRYPKLEKGGYMAEGGEIVIKSGNDGKLKEVFKREKNQRNEILANEIFEQEKSKGKTVFMMVDEEIYDSYIKEGEEDEYAKGGYMADGGMTPLDVSNQIYDITVRIAELGDINTEAAYEETKNLMKMRAALQARALHLQDMEMASGGYMADGGSVFSEKDLKEVLSNAVYHFYKGLNEVEAAMSYLDRKGQGGLKTALSKKFNLEDLKESIEKMDEYTSDEKEKGGYMAKGGKLEIGDMVMVDDSGYVKLFSEFDITKPAKIISKGKTKSSGKVVYFYGLEMADGRKPFNNAPEYKLTKVSEDGGYMAKGGRVDDFSDKIQEGDIVWDSNNKRYGVVLNTYDYKYGEIRLDSDGNQSIEDLYKLGSEGDKGTKEKLKEALLAHKRLMTEYPDRYDKVNYAKGGYMAGGGELHRSQEKYAYGRYMAMGGAIEHGLKKGDHIMVVRGNMLGIKNEITGEIVTLNIETGERKESKE